MIGACVLHGPRFVRRGLTQDQWDAAGAEGFGSSSRGEEGLFEVFEEMFRSFRERQGVGGPQAVFGSLYAWVRVPKPSRPCGPIRDGLRAFILGRMAVEPGSRFPGDGIPRRLRHSVASLAREKGVHPKTLNRALVLTGLMPEGDPDRVDGHLSVEARAGELLADRLVDATSVARIPEHLDCTRTHAEQLVREGFIERIAGRDGSDATMSNIVAKEDVDAFLVRFRATGLPVGSPGPGMRTVVDAAKVSKRKFVDVVRLVLDGDLARVELLEEDLRLKSVIVDPEEVGRVLDAREARGMMPIRDAAARLGLGNGGVRALVTERGRDGMPYLRAFVKGDPMGTETWWFDPLDLDEFAAGHVDLAALAGERGISASAHRRHLKDAGIEPILPWERLEKLVYRRADL
jgi:hypothetical protein